jgi:hypothetical protein
VLNVTAVGPTSPGYLTIYPQGSIRPVASNLNFSAGETVANLVEVPLSSSGQVSIYNGSAGDTNVVVDVAGYYSASGESYTPVSPVRICDTRSGNPSGLSGAEAQCNNHTLSPGVPQEVQVGGVGGLPASGVAAVVVNLTVTGPAAPGYLSAYPAGGQAPMASNVNFYANDSVANRGVIELSPSGAIDLVSDVYTNVIVDVAGYYSSSGKSYTPISPVRICDTRAVSAIGGSGDVTAGVAGQCDNSGSALQANTTLALQVGGLGGVPTTATAVVLNVTVTNTTSGSYLSAYPTGASRPMASDLNWAPGETVPNLVVVKLGSAGTVDLYNLAGAANVVVDVEGYYG